jgi:hypothetical protein
VKLHNCKKEDEQEQQKIANSKESRQNEIAPVDEKGTTIKQTTTKSRQPTQQEEGTTVEKPAPRSTKRRTTLRASPC